MDTLKDKTIELNSEAAIANIKRKGTPDRVYYFEHGLEPGIKQTRNLTDSEDGFLNGKRVLITIVIRSLQRSSRVRLVA